MATTISLSLCAFGAVAVVSCSDSGSERITRPDATLTPLGRVSATAVRDRKRVHGRNKEEFVGAAHNKALDAFRRELRKPGVLTRNVCDYVQTFGAHQDRLPAGSLVTEDVRWHAARSAADSSVMCRKFQKQRVSGVAFRSPLAPRPSAAEESPDALLLLNEIQDAVTVSPSSYELAGRLSTVLDRTAGLNVSDQLVIGATVSVAQNSFEYWESNYDMFVREVQDEYAACAQLQSQGGVSAETARDNCMNGRGDEGPVAFYDRSVPGEGPRLTGRHARRNCRVDFGAGFRRIVAADIKGAFMGAANTMKGGPESAAAGAIIGAALGSTWAALELAWEVLSCMYQF